jgi:hypothetical protein
MQYVQKGCAHGTTHSFGPTGKGWLFLITTFLAFLLGETFAPGYATRYCVGKNIKETRIGIAGVGVFLAFTFSSQ